MFPLLLPLVRAVSTMARAGGSLALGAAKTAVKAVGATGEALTRKRRKVWYSKR